MLFLDYPFGALLTSNDEEMAEVDLGGRFRESGWDKKMTPHLKIILALAVACGIVLPKASAGPAPGGPTYSSAVGQRGHAGGAWWDWVASGEKPRRGGVASDFSGGGLFGHGPSGQNWQRPGHPNPGNNGNSPPPGSQNSSNLLDDDPSPDDTDDLPLEDNPPEEDEESQSLNNFGGTYLPQDGPYREPRPVPAPGALALGTLGLALIHRWRGSSRQEEQ